MKRKFAKIASPRYLEAVLDGRGNQAALAYYTAGATVTRGAYRCTFCGHLAHIDRPCSLPLCPVCDNAEFLVSLPTQSAGMHSTASPAA